MRAYTKNRNRSVDEDPLLERLAWLMDESIRIGPWSIGLDALMGIVPGIGDMAGALVSMFIIGRAMRQGIARGAVVRMLINVGWDSLIGAVPFLGDIFDFAWKSNVKNVAIYKEALRGERQPVRDWAFLGVVAVACLAFITLPIVGLVYLAKLLGPYMPSF